MFLGFVPLNGTIIVPMLTVDANGQVVNPDIFPNWRVYGNGQTLTSGNAQLAETGLITGVAAGSPAVITSPNHKLQTGAVVSVDLIGGISGINGLAWTVTRIDANTFSLNGSTGTGTYTSGGFWVPTGLFVASIDVTEANLFAAGMQCLVHFSYGVTGTKRGTERTFQVS